MKHWLREQWEIACDAANEAVPFLVVCVLSLVVLASVCLPITLYQAVREEEATPQPLPTHTFRCPEDADMVIRYGVEPAGMVAFCVYSDDIEGIID